MESFRNSPASKAAIFSFVSLLLIALFMLIWHTANFFLLVFGGILFSVLVSSLAYFLSHKTKIRYTISLLLVLVLLVGILGGTFWLLAPTVSEQAEELSKSLPQAFQNLKESLSQTSWGKQLLAGMPQKPGKFLSSHKDILGQLTGIFSSTLSVLANVVIVLITGIYLAANPGSYKKGFVQLFTPRYRHRLSQVLDQCYDTLSNWLLSRFISMVVVGVATGVGLALLGIPLPIVLAIIAAFLNFIPNLGPYLALIPALPLAYLQGSDQALYVFLLYMCIQTIEGYVLTPMLDKKLVSMPPALLLFGQVLLGILVGITGILLASPIIAVLLVLIKELYIKDYLEKRAGPGEA
ncbi:AI-2E family transporter [Adhaeribacter radiodurans]|uniref:AI-2E family transporter n=1 Tax=Adhaeribacter radiodurans TaxID=2745197 RepID=A0A7L7L2W3_9BACT|nr:AI-2E family transporter [Adhaeribacter radiodurans]QMU27100.1 AI-2E family transporter [Adhaeribacter radiodurans]